MKFTVAFLTLAVCLAQAALAAPVPSDEEVAAMQARGKFCLSKCLGGSSSSRRPVERPPVTNDRAPAHAQNTGSDPYGPMDISVADFGPARYPRPQGVGAPGAPAGAGAGRGAYGQQPAGAPPQRQESMYVSGPLSEHSQVWPRPPGY